MTTNSTTETRTTLPAPEPGRNCPLCPRLADFREQTRAREPGWFNAPVASFGDANARLLIVGLAPGMQGANRTGRPFTGDFAGDLLYATLLEYGFAKGIYQARPDDGLEAGRLPDQQRGALRAAAEQAAARRDQHLPAIPVGDDRDDAKTARNRDARPDRARIDGESARVAQRRRRPLGTAPCIWPAISGCTTAITARATTRTPAC